MDYADDVNQIIEDAFLADRASVKVPAKMKVDGENVMLGLSWGLY